MMIEQSEFVLILLIQLIFFKSGEYPSGIVDDWELYLVEIEEKTC